MGLIIEGPPSQGFSHHFPYDNENFNYFGLVLSTDFSGAEFPGWEVTWMSQELSQRSVSGL